jgi:hypothetical protein
LRSWDEKSIFASFKPFEHQTVTAFVVRVDSEYMTPLEEIKEARARLKAFEADAK